MKHTLYLLIAVLTSILSVSCSEERLAGSVSSSEFEEGELVLASLHLSVNGFEVNVQSGSRAPEDEPTQEELVGTDEENAIHNIWVFQFNTNGDQLINPRYYEIADQAELQDLKVWLKPGMASTVYVVANTGQPNWIKENTDVSTLTKLESLDLFNLEPQFTNEGQTLSLPMEGKEDNVTVSEVSGAPEKNSVTVHVTRMFAKLQVKVNIDINYMTLRSIAIDRIPKACRIKARTGEGENKTNYENGYFYWNSTTFDSEDTDDMHIVYLAENMQGIVENGSDKNKDNAPSKALRLSVEVDRKDPITGENTQPSYVAYPGTDEKSDFNIKRNCIYNVFIDIISDMEVHIPSSNCFVVYPGNLMSFEPYYRVEKGGNYNFKDYLDADDLTGKKVIDRVGIIWQTKDAIGDNTEGDKVWYNSDMQKIYVQTGKKGNALIAAYNVYDEIIWSWHIWVTDHDPANLSNAVRYNTYQWDNEGIYPDKYTSGLEVMPCNIGALANKPETPKDIKPFGMLYQWGRKDPFPPVLKVGKYDVEHVGEYYDNSNEEIVGMTSTEDKTQLFHSVSGINALSIEDPIRYTIQHPTVFMCGTKEVEGGEQYVENLLNYQEEGDWNPKHDDKLWGGLPPVDDGSMKKYTINVEHNVHIYDNYGPSKTIFDPCPYGWRVAPGELWLGFTKTGLNPKSWDEVNSYDDYPDWKHDDNHWGTYIYMQSWKGENGAGYTYFPTQGTRVGDGMGIRVGSCGNYHNATTDSNNRVNILHIHNYWGYFHIFEYQFPMYYVKSVAGPIRCVRDPEQ